MNTPEEMKRFTINCRPNAKQEGKKSQKFRQYCSWNRYKIILTLKFCLHTFSGNLVNHITALLLRYKVKMQENNAIYSCKENRMSKNSTTNCWIYTNCAGRKCYNRHYWKMSLCRVVRPFLTVKTRDTRQIASMPSARKKHSAKWRTLSKGIFTECPLFRHSAKEHFVGKRKKLHSANLLSRQKDSPRGTWRPDRRRRDGGKSSPSALSAKMYFSIF